MVITQMVLVNEKRVEIHPDFLAELFFTWREKWRSTQDKSAIVKIANYLCDEGWDQTDAIYYAKNQVVVNAVNSVISRFLNEYRLSTELNKKTGNKSVIAVTGASANMPTL